jgi:hypothetical protein
MKGPIIATGLVLAVGCVLALWQQSKVGTLEKDLDVLQGEAAKRGIPLHVSASAGRRSRGAEDRSAAHLVRKVTSLLERVEMIERAGGRPDEALRDQIVEMTVDLMELSPTNMRKVLARLRMNSSLSDDTKAKLIGSSLLFVSGDHPEAALRLFEESKDLLGKGSVANHVVTSALHSWAEANPEAAMQWLKKNETPPSGISREEMQHAVLGGAAKHDPVMAFRLIGEMGLEVSTEACEVIAASLADTQKGREALLSAMRGYVSDMENQRAARTISGAVMEAVARGVGKNSFESVSQWLDGESLPESDLASFAEGLSWFSTGNETGAWLDWMAQRMPADKLGEPVESLVGDWVEEDYLAAGKWLTQVPDGPIRIPAIKAYAEAVAAYDPETATQWAMTIADMDARRRTLMAIHDNWPTEDEEGAAKFAAEHGLE